jgi:hypothetical protein
MDLSSERARSRMIPNVPVHGPHVADAHNFRIFFGRLQILDLRRILLWRLLFGLIDQ